MEGILSFAKWVMTSFRDLNKQRSQYAKFGGKNSNEILSLWTEILTVDFDGHAYASASVFGLRSSLVMLVLNQQQPCMGGRELRLQSRWLNPRLTERVFQQIRVYVYARVGPACEGENGAKMAKCHNF